LRLTPGNPSEVDSKRTSSVPKNRARAAAAAPENVLCPDVYDGNGGVGRGGSQFGSSGTVGAFLCATSRIAVIGRQNSLSNLMIQQTRPASARLRFSIAKRRALSDSDRPRALATVQAMWFQCPTGVDVLMPSAQKFAISVCSGVRTELFFAPR